MRFGEEVRRREQKHKTREFNSTLLGYALLNLLRAAMRAAYTYVPRHVAKLDSAMISSGQQTWKPYSADRKEAERFQRISGTSYRSKNTEKFEFQALHNHRVLQIQKLMMIFKSVSFSKLWRQFLRLRAVMIPTECQARGKSCDSPNRSKLSPELETSGVVPCERKEKAGSVLSADNPSKVFLLKMSAFDLFTPRSSTLLTVRRFFLNFS